MYEASPVPNPLDDEDVLWMKIARSLGVYAVANGGTAQNLIGGQDQDYYIYKAAANLYSIP